MDGAPAAAAEDAARMSSLMSDLQEAAGYIAKVMSSSGFDADFTPASLQQAARFVEANTRSGVADPDGFFGRFLNARRFALGAYVGEVAIRSLGGSWVRPEVFPDSAANLALRLGDGREVQPMQVAEASLSLGGRSLVAFAESVGLLRPTG